VGHSARGIHGSRSRREARREQVGRRGCLPLESLATLALGSGFHPHEQAGANKSKGKSDAHSDEAADNEGGDHS
jgi:hypothetical protein